jgi:phage regulator Rha-like protein
MVKDLVFKGEYGMPATSSLLVAQRFGKRHADVMRAMEQLLQNMSQIGEDECKSNFAFTSQLVEQPNGVFLAQVLVFLTQYLFLVSNI